MFRHDRRELERLAARLDVERARVAASRAGLARAGRHAFDDKLALLGPLTAGALTGAAVQHREPRRGGRFSAKELLAAVTAVTGLVEVFRDELLPWLVASDDAAADPETHPASVASRTLEPPDANAAEPPGEPPWPQRIPLR